MPTPSDNANAVELGRMIASYVVGLPNGGERAALKAANISTTRWAAYYFGESTMPLPVIVALARALDMTPGQLLAKAEGRHRG